MFHFNTTKKTNYNDVIQRTMKDSPLQQLSNYILNIPFRISHTTSTHNVWLCVSVLLTISSGTSGLLTGEHQPYDVMCRHNTSTELTPLPWDCGGYVQCMPLEAGAFRAVWVQCSEGRLFHPVERACVRDYTDCPSLKETAPKLCPLMPQLQFPHATSCAMYHDCSRPSPRGGLGPYEEECPHPMLFNQDTYRCEIRDMNSESMCGTRPVPKEKCHYTLGCNVTSCRGLSDGHHPDPAAPFTEHYYICRNGLMVTKSKCELKGQIFDPSNSSCTDVLLAESVTSYCSLHPTAIFSDPTKCSLFYDCSRMNWHTKLKPFQSECAYPRMFDEFSQSCATFSDVACGNRKLTCAPCDYTVGHCVGSHCIPCSASCKGLSDGANAYPGLPLTSSFLLCQSHRTRDIHTCPSATLFDPILRRCSHEISQEGLDSYCLDNPAAIIPHPSECSLFYNCSLSQFHKVHENLPARVSECPYPQLVNMDTGECSPFTQVSCGPRREPLAPCDYVTNRCHGSNCTVCEDLLPSCTGRGDGYFPFINHEMTARYTVCEGQRVVGAARCPEGTIFDQMTLACTDTVGTDSLLHYCTSHPKGRVENPASCSQYYDCTALFGGLKHCPAGQLYDVPYRKCMAANKVDCNQKPEKVAASIIMNVISAANEFKNASLSTTQNPFNKFSQYPLQATQSIESVITTSTPSPIFARNINSICNLDQSLVLRKKDNCGQFYNCSQPASPLGSFIAECPVGALFDDVTSSCLPFDQVTCVGGFEPKQACDYRLHCLEYSNDAACSACHVLRPTCQGAADGPAPTYGGFKHDVLFCRKGRASEFTTCPVGQYYDNVKKACSSEVRREVIISACSLTPGRTVSHPTNCAKFIQCSKMITTAGGVQMKFKVGECPYPLLFEDGVCQSFKSVVCGMRKEPVAPCEYEGIQEKASTCKDERNPTGSGKLSSPCPTCEEDFPTCTEYKDGFHAHPGQLFTPHFIQCEAGRTMAINKCIGSVFDPDSRKCGLSIKNIFTIAKIIPKYFCAKYSTAVIPHPTLCHRYFSCPKKGSPKSGGKVSYVKSCPYPGLFDTNNRRCDSFAKVFMSKGCNDSEKAR